MSAAVLLAALWAGLAVPAVGCAASGDGDDPGYTAEELVEAQRAKSNAADLLRGALEASGSSLAVRLRAIRGLVEAGRIDQVRGALREMPLETARTLVRESIPNLRWLAMAGSVPEGRLRLAQVHAKDALQLLEEWMTPDLRRDARAVVVRWFLQDPIGREKQGEMPLGRADPAIRAAVAAGLTLRGVVRWDRTVELAKLAVQAGGPADRTRLAGEAAAAYVELPYDTPEQRAEAQQGMLAAFRALGGDSGALAEPLAARVRDPGTPAAARLDAGRKLDDLAFLFGPLNLGAVVTDAAAPLELRTLVAGTLAGEGDPAAAAAAVLEADPAMFEAVRRPLREVKKAGRIVDFVDLVAAGRDRLVALPGRCDALAQALASMGPNRSADAASRLLASTDPFVVSFGVEVLSRVGTAEHLTLLDGLRSSRDRSPCWPDATIGERVVRAVDAITSRQAGAVPGDEADEGAGEHDGGQP